MTEVRVRFYATLRDIVGGRQVRVPVPASPTLGDVLDALVARWPELREHLVGPDGGFSKRASLYLDGRAARFLTAGLETRVEPGQEIDCFPAVAGG